MSWLLMLGLIIIALRELRKYTIKTSEKAKEDQLAAFVPAIGALLALIIGCTARDQDTLEGAMWATVIAMLFSTLILILVVGDNSYGTPGIWLSALVTCMFITFMLDIRVMQIVSTQDAAVITWWKLGRAFAWAFAALILAGFLCGLVVSLFKKWVWRPLAAKARSRRSAAQPAAS